MKPLKLSKEEPQHGAAIYVVGYPGAGDILSDTQAHTSDSVTITDGIISAIRSFTIEKGGNPVKLLQGNAAINSGNSGGPLFDTEGVVVGVNTYKVNADSQGVFGSVAISELWSLLNQYGIEVPEQPESVEEVIEESSFLMPVLICAVTIGLVLVIILIAKSRRGKAPQRKAKASKSPAVTLQTYMEKYPQGLGIGGAVSVLLPAAIQLRDLHNDGKLHLQVCTENILIGADGASLKDPSSQETGRFNSGFAAPEIYRGAGFGITSDIYSFAAVLLYAATGKVPANSLQWEALEQDFALLEDMAFAAIIRKAMTPNILDRTQSMQELIYNIAVYKAPVQEKKVQPQRTVKTVPASEREEIPVPAPVKREQAEILKHQKKTVPKKKHRKRLPIAAVLVCGIVAVVLMWKPAEKQEEIAELQSTEQAETTVPMTPEEAAYAEAETLLADGETAKAAIAFGKLGDYSDARERSFALWREITPTQIGCSPDIYTAVVKKDGTVMLLNYTDTRQRQCLEWTDIIAVSSTISSAAHTVGLKKDGTVIAVGANQCNQCDTSSLSDVVTIDTTAHGFTVGLKADGTVYYTGSSLWGYETQIQELSSWQDIAVIRLLSSTVFGIKKDGTVVTASLNLKGERYKDWSDMLNKDWNDIIAVDSVGIPYIGNHYLGLKADGTVICSYDDLQSEVSQWSDIVAVSGGFDYVIGLKSDGTVVSTGKPYHGDPLELSDWYDMAAVYAYSMGAIGVKNDGSMVITGKEKNLPSALIKNWTDIRLPN